MLTLSARLIGENLDLSMRGKTTQLQPSFRETPNKLLTMPVRYSRLKTASADVCFNTNAHLLVDLGLQLLKTTLNQNKCSKSDEATIDVSSQAASIKTDRNP